MKKTFWPLVALAAVLAIGLGCYWPKNEFGAKKMQKNEPTNVSSQQEAGQVTEIGKSINKFSFKFAKTLYDGNANQNFVVSPISLWLPAASLANSASDNMKAPFQKFLEVEGISLKDLPPSSKALINSLKNPPLLTASNAQGEKNESPLAIANAAFVDPGTEFSSAYQEDFKDSFEGSVFQSSFRDGSAVRDANNWVNNKTKGVIPKIVEEFNDSTVAAIVNAIYFSDRFVNEFSPEMTKDGVFHRGGGETTATFMHNDDAYLPYYEDSQLQAARLELKTGGALTVLLPRSGSSKDLLDSLTDDSFNKILNGMSKRKGSFAMPKFKIDSGSMNLNNAVKAMGLNIFDYSAKPLDKLLKGRDDAYISDIAQKASINVDEKGTTAAAVTILQVSVTSMPLPGESFNMACDRPFVYVLTAPSKDLGDQVIFIGALNNPD